MVPTLLPFTFHWYDGVRPPLDGLALKVTTEPTQVLPLGFDDIVTPAATVLVTFIDMPLLVCIFGNAQVALLVITQVIMSPCARVVPALYVALLVPTLAPFLFHW